jgi:hypothetical protein
MELSIDKYFPGSRPAPAFQAELSIMQGLYRLADDLDATALTSRDLNTVAALRRLAEEAGAGRKLLGGSTAQEFQGKILTKKHERSNRASVVTLLEDIAKALTPLGRPDTTIGNWNTVLVLDRFAVWKDKGREVARTGTSPTQVENLDLGLAGFAEEARLIFCGLILANKATPEFSAGILQAWRDTPAEAAANPAIQARNNGRVLFQVLQTANPAFKNLAGAVDKFLWEQGMRYPVQPPGEMSQVEVPAPPAAERPARRISRNLSLVPNCGSGTQDPSLRGALRLPGAASLGARLRLVR